MKRHFQHVSHPERQDPAFHEIFCMVSDSLIFKSPKDAFAFLKLDRKFSADAPVLCEITQDCMLNFFYEQEINSEPMKKFVECVICEIHETHAAQLKVFKHGEYESMSAEQKEFFSAIVQCLNADMRVASVFITKEFLTTSDKKIRKEECRLSAQL